jgi:hypothetical protein
LQLYPKAIADPIVNDQARDELRRLANYLHIDVPVPDGDGFITLPVTPDQRDTALAEVLPGWEERALFLIPPV